MNIYIILTKLHSESLKLLTHFESLIYVNTIMYSRPSLSQEKDLFCVRQLCSYAEARLSYRLDVCLSVRPSVTRWYCVENGSTYRQTVFTAW